MKDLLRDWRFVVLVGVINASIWLVLFRNVAKVGPPPTTEQIVKSHGYTFERHKVLTEDGFHLILHRIPRSPSHKDDSPRQVVFLQHGLLSCSSTYVSAGPNTSLAFFLADSGYDVWMGNARGNEYSSEHYLYNTTDSEYWDYSWHEMGVYDLPACIDYILELTGQKKLHYVGHSMGTTVLFVLLSTRPEYNSKIAHSFALAPIAFFQGAKSIVLEWMGIYYAPTRFASGNKNWLPGVTFFKEMVYRLCQPQFMASAVCVEAYKQIFGSSNQINKKALPSALAMSMSSTGIKTLIHYRQNFVDEKFRHWREGSNFNIKQDEKHTAADYPLEKITSPMTLIYSDQDITTPEQNILRLYNVLPNSSLYKVPNFNHLDFVFGTNAKDTIYKKILKTMKKEENKT